MSAYKDTLQLMDELAHYKQIVREINEVIEHSFDGIVVVNAEGKVTYQNEAYEKITGLDEDELVGRSTEKLVEAGVFNESVSKRVFKSKKVETIIQKFRTGRELLVTGAPIFDEYGEVKKVVCNIRDLTNLNQLEKDIIQLEQKKIQVNQELEELQKRKNLRNSIIAHSEEMEKVVERALRVAQVDSVVLIQGESGVGKEGIVNLIHQHSHRSNQPLIKINCGAIPEQLLESELFGYESGAFTGANKGGKKGILESASGGTVFFDEIGEMPLSLQVKLLRVLQEYEIVRIGGVEPIKVDVRIIAATNRDLAQEAEEGRFRKDLFYRINIIPIQVPALRERSKDVVPLIFHFTKELSTRYGLQRSFSDAALQLLQSYHWPGNVRELKNVVERVCLLANKEILDVEDLTKELQLVKQPVEVQAMESKQVVSETREEEASGKLESFIEPFTASSSDQLVSLKEQVGQYEQKVIRHYLRKYPSVRQAAKAMQVDQSTLVRKMQRYNMQSDEKNHN